MGAGSTEENLRDLLVPTHLYYDVGTKSLRTRAFGEIITKILFLTPEKKARFTTIAEESARIVGVPKLTIQDIQDGLEFLADKGVILKQGNFWFLKHEESEKIESDLKSAQGRIDYILNKHFGTKLDRQALQAWFKDIAISYFGRFGDVWAKRLKREPAVTPDADQIEDVISTTIKTHHLEENEVELRDGFKSFLRDYNDPNVEQQIWSFAQAMLSARLVTAGVGPDPLAISEFRDCRLLLDTNVLLTAALEKSRLAAAFSALANTIKQIGTSFAITRETINEYETVVARKRKEAIRAVESYPIAVLEEAKDPFLKTAIARGCIDAESFGRFFDSIRSVPDKIGEEEIHILDGAAIDKAAEAGRRDLKKQAQIEAEWKTQRHYDKPKHSAEHDAALDSVLDYLRKSGERLWIISADSPMQTLAARWAGSNPPTWIGVDTLIQILAVSSGGPGHKPDNFAPLFGTIIRDDLHTGDSIYSLEDLDALLDLDDRVKELTKEEIESFASKMRRLRMAGKPKGDSELQLEINRTFQRKKMTSDANATRLERQVGEMELNLKKETAGKALIIDALVSQIFRGERLKKIILWLLKIIVILAIGCVLFIVGFNSSKFDSTLGYFLMGLGLTEFILPLFIWIIPAYRKIKTEAQSIAEEKAKKIIENQPAK